MGNVRKGTIIIVALSVLILGAVLGAGLLGSTKEDKTMGLTNDGRVSNTVIPVIDAAVPTRTETATFALG